MAVSTIPDIVLLDTLTAGIEALRLDYRTVIANGRPESESILYILLQSTILKRYQFFEQAKKLILTTAEKDGNKQLEVKLTFDGDTWKNNPMIVITCPADNGKNNSLGLGEGNNQEIVGVDNDGFPVYKRLFERTFVATYQLIIITQNSDETLLLYHLIRMLVIACHEHLELSGLYNIQYSGGNLNLRDVLQAKTFSKYIGLNFEYNSVSTEFNINPIVDQIQVIIKLRENLDDDSDS